MLNIKKETNRNLITSLADIVFHWTAFTCACPAIETIQLETCLWNISKQKHDNYTHLGIFLLTILTR